MGREFLLQLNTIPRLDYDFLLLRRILFSLPKPEVFLVYRFDRVDIQYFCRNPFLQQQGCSVHCFFQHDASGSDCYVCAGGKCICAEQIKNIVLWRRTFPWMLWRWQSMNTGNYRTCLSNYKEEIVCPSLGLEVSVAAEFP